MKKLSTLLLAAILLAGCASTDQTNQKPDTPSVEEHIETIDKDGVTISVDKVELEDDQTRIYLSGVNDSDAKCDLFMLETKLVQDGTQYSLKLDANEGKDTFPSEIEPGESVQGWLTFQPVEKRNFSLWLVGFSSDYQDDTREFRFNLSVPQE